MRPLSCVLYVPADKPRALDKIATLATDGVIIDLEDAVAPERKEEGREALRARFRDWNRAEARPSPFLAIRINAFEGEHGTEDLLMARGAKPDAIVIPKVSRPQDIVAVEDALAETDAPQALRLFAMIETAKAIADIEAIAALGSRSRNRLGGFVLGTNDLALETGIDGADDRFGLVPHLARIVIAAKANGLIALDGVYNRIDDRDGLSREARQGRRLGFDGKTVIHPGQIETVNAAFAPTEDEIAWARSVVAAFADPMTAGSGAIRVDGQMVERLHLKQAEGILARI